MQGQETEMVGQAIACGIQRGRDLYSGSCFDRALKQVADAAGVPLSNDLLRELDARLDALTAQHNTMGVLHGQSGGHAPGAIPIRPTAGIDLSEVRRLDARRRALEEGTHETSVASHGHSHGQARQGALRCVLFAAFCLFLAVLGLTPQGRSFFGQATVVVEQGWQYLRTGSRAESPTSLDESSAVAAGVENAAGTEPRRQDDALALDEEAVVNVTAGAPAQAATPTPPTREPVPVPDAAVPPSEPPAALAEAPSSQREEPLPLAAVTTGMTKERVVQLLGAPRMLVGWDGKEKLTYPQGNVVLVNGKVTDVGRQGREGGER